MTTLPLDLRAPWLAVRLRLPGLLVCVLVALAATFLTEHHGGPQLLYALLIGLSLHVLMEHPHIVPGVEFCARVLLRAGVALLGLRVTLDQVAALGAGTALLVTAALLLTIVGGWALGRRMGLGDANSLLTGCAVGICGASAALAVSTVLPRSRESERFTLLTVVGVTLLSTLAMVLYPLLIKSMGLSTAQGAIFLGGTVHDVAQVVAAGMLLGPGGAELAALVKLLRVMLLLPVVMIVSLLFRAAAAPGGSTGSRPPLLPGFLLGFVALMLINGTGWVSPWMNHAAGELSRWLLVVAIAAAGIKTTFGDLMKLGWRPVLLLVAETAWIAGLVLAGILVLGLGRA
jgi:uncharacterized integral membrane protein (TIGR00698 family)